MLLRLLACLVYLAPSGRFDAHELLRQFAEERLVDEGAEHAVARARLGGPLGVASAPGNPGVSGLTRGRLKEARARFGETVPVCKAAGDRQSLA